MKNEKKKVWKSITVIAVVLSVLAVAMVGTASAKSLYVIDDINAYPNIPISAYDIQPAPAYLVHQTTDYIPDRNGGAVGLAVDSGSGYLFATFEFSGVIDLINGTTMTRVGQVTAPSASNLAGIVVDLGKQKVYTVDRNTNHLYVYQWNPTGPTLTLEGTSYVTLDCNSGLYDITLDEASDLLYVGDSTTSVKYYDTATWTRQGQFTVSHLARGIAIDVPNQRVYSGSGGPSGGTLLSKYELSTTSESTLNVGSVVLGVAVDQLTGLVHITTRGGTYNDNLLVYDSSLTNPPLWTSGDIGNPTGLCIGEGVSYNPLGLTKDDGVTTCVKPGDTISYTMSYKNGNPTDVTGVTLVDKVPAEVTVTDTGGGTQSGNTVTWDIGTLTTGQSGSKTLTVTVKAGTAAGTVIDNAATINANEANTGPTTVHERTTVCGVSVPEFTSVAIPVAGILGMVLLISLRKRREE